MTEQCPHCGQPMRRSILGIFLPPLKAEIVDSIKRSGDVGLSTRELVIMHYGERKISPLTIKAHIGQINDLLEETDFKIVSDGPRREARWCLRRERSS